MSRISTSLIPVLAIIAASIQIGGCANVVPSFDIPHMPSTSGPPVPTVSSIVRRIRCELIEIASPEGEDINRLLIADRDIQAVVELSLSVTQDGKIAPSFSFPQGAVSIATGFSFEKSREQNFTTYLTFSMEELARTPRGKLCNLPADTNLSGTLGIAQMFQLATSSGFFQKWDSTKDTGVFGGSITFTVDSQLTPTGPSWTLTSFAGTAPNVSAGNKNVDKLTFGFVEGPKAGKGRALARVDAYSVIANVKQNQIANSLQLIANAR